MEHNLFLQRFSKYKKLELDSSPFHFLLNTHIELNPHQINAFCAAIDALKTGGIVLADEVGLGKTIEAALVLKYMLASGAKRVLISVPASLRKQWEMELEEKFELKSYILERLTVEREPRYWQNRLKDPKEYIIAITSYAYSSQLMKRFPDVKWDFVIIDEAHNLRNVIKTKRAKNLHEIANGIPKILLTATPLQNSLTDLHGVVSFIDDRIFGNEKIFRKRYIDEQNYSDLKRELAPVLYRTLRKDVSKYMNFKKRTCRTVDFALTGDEIQLYQRVNDFLKRDPLYSITSNNRNLIILVIRKLLASSSFALIETFEVLKKRLEKLYSGTKSAKAQDGFDLFWSLVEDEIDETEAELQNDEDLVIEKQHIESELNDVKQIIDVAKRIKTNAKIKALMSAVKIAFDYQQEHSISKKILIFTESKRTQKYIAEELRKKEFADDDVVLFNGDFDDSMKKIYRAWQAKNYGNRDYGRNVEAKHAIVDYFRNNAKVLICTDAGSEGLNLQFCNTVINYDLPWNPMKIEQRIGRCHRYGQENDVVAINLLNTQNVADMRVYEILSKKFELFEGVFGASDVALGTLDSGINFEKYVLDIYQKCNTTSEFNKEFDKLDRKLNAKRDKKARELRNILLSDSVKKASDLDNTKLEIDSYLKDVEYWEHYAEDNNDINVQYWKNEQWGEECLGAHGFLFMGAFCNSGKFLFPILLLCDEKGEYIDFKEHELVPVIEKIHDDDLRTFSPSQDESALFQRIYDQLTVEMTERYNKSVVPIKEYNKKKIENWKRIQSEQLNVALDEKNQEIQKLHEQELNSGNFYEKVDIRKKIEEKKKSLIEFQNSFHDRESSFNDEGDREIEEFNKQLDINPILLVSVILKF